MSITIDHQVTIVVEECIECGTPFGMDSSLQAGLKRTGRTFYCPNGHAQVYSKPLEKRLKEVEAALKESQQNSQWWREQAEEKGAELVEKRNQLKTTRAALTRTKKRVAGGACPCCNRQFSDLQRHMASQHPEYSQSEAGDA